jgi:hypothetical protein
MDYLSETDAIILDMLLEYGLNEWSSPDRIEVNVRREFGWTPDSVDWQAIIDHLRVHPWCGCGRANQLVAR